MLILAPAISFLLTFTQVLALDSSCPQSCLDYMNANWCPKDGSETAHAMSKRKLNQSIPEKVARQCYHVDFSGESEESVYDQLKLDTLQREINIQ